MQKLLFSMSLAVALAGGANTALAQDKVDAQTTNEIQRQDTVPPATGRNLPEQAGTTEPSSKVPNTNPDPNVLVNGVLTVPGAMTDVDTAPAKFSARTDADDQLPIAGYRLKHLTSDQRSEIVQGLGSQRDAPPRSADGNEAYAVVGAELPSTVALTGLTAMPETLTAKFPGLRGTAFIRAAGKMLVVDLDNSLVIGVL
jgi:hypothetical protein